jgi:hypothetical protein
MLGFQEQLNVLLISHGLGNNAHHPALGRISSEQDIKVARIADSRMAEAFDRLIGGFMPFMLKLTIS